MLYLDTALVVSALTAEDATSRVHSWLDRKRSETLATSAWVSTEFAAAIAVKVRMGELSVESSERSHAAYRSLAAGSVQREITSRHFERATELARLYEAGLRGGDALHLAIALGKDATLCTPEKRFVRACALLNLPHELV